MRFFKVEVSTRDGSLNMSLTHELGDLYEQVGRRAVVMPESSSRIRRSSWGFGEDAAKTFPVYVFAMDGRATPEFAEQVVRDACDVWGVGQVEGVTAAEATFTDDLLDHMGYYEVSGRTAIQKGNLFEIYDFARSKRVFKDWKVARRSPDECREAARDCSCSESLSAEADRILAGGGREEGAGAPMPVHYLVEGCERSDHEESVEALLEALGAAGRLPSEHVLSFNFDNVRLSSQRIFVNAERLRDAVNDSLGFAVAGNAVVVQYGRGDRGGRYDGLAYECLRRFVDVLRSHLEETLVVFSVPSGNEDLKARVRKLAGVPLVEIAPDAAPDARGLTRDEALAQLEKRAAEAGEEPDELLAGMLDDALADASFSDLDGLFEDWRRAKLVGERFPEYGAELAASLELRDMRQPGALERLDELVGLGPVKRQIRDILARFRMNREAERLGLPARPFSMHLAFLGSPGTGKTEVARLYGEVLKEAGVLAEGRVVSVSGGDVNKCDVDALFDRARGSVLFVDEAYAMGNPVAIAEFIAHMENRRDDTVVILAGYEGHMNALFGRNPGFRSRIGFELRFPDYSPDEMLEIFELMCRRAGLELPDGARSEARDLLARSGRRADQGNARHVRKLFEDAVGAQQVRLARDHEEGGELTRERMATLEPCDVAEAGCLTAGKQEAPAREELEGLVGLDGVKRLVSERIDFMRVQKARRDAGLDAEAVPAHMAFVGPPGAGKTEVARLMGRILRDEGVLSTGGFYEVTGGSLVKPCVGEGAAAVRALFQEARGSVVFIDEAYAMAKPVKGGIYTEAVDELIAQMENYRDEVVVILAGYEREIEDLLKSNPGFASRVRTKIAFPDYAPRELAEIFMLMLEKRGLVAGEGVAEKALAIMERASRADDFGNARFARNLVEDALLRQGTRLARELDAADDAPDAERLRRIEPEDLEWNSSPSASRPPIGFAA